MVTFFACSLGNIAQAVVSFAGNYYARDLITGLWRTAPVYLGLVRDHFSHFFPYNDPLLDRVTPPPPLNVAWAISCKFANLMGQKIPEESPTPTSIPDSTYAFGETPAANWPKLTKMP